MRQGTHTHPLKAFAEEGWLGVTGVKGRASRQRWIYLIFSTKFPLFRPHNAAAVVGLLLVVQFGRYECGCMPHCCAAGVMPTNSLSFGGWAFVLSHKKTLFFGGFSAETRKSADTHTRARTHTQTHMCLLDLHAFALTLSLGIPRFSIALAYYFWFLYFMLLFIFCFIAVSSMLLCEIVLVSATICQHNSLCCNNLHFGCHYLACNCCYSYFC